MKKGYHRKKYELVTHYTRYKRFDNKYFDFNYFWLVFSGVRVTRSLVLCTMFCISLFIILYFIFWPFCFMIFLDLRILITPLLSSNSF